MSSGASRQDSHESESLPTDLAVQGGMSAHRNATKSTSSSLRSIDLAPQNPSRRGANPEETAGLPGLGPRRESDRGKLFSRKATLGLDESSPRGGGGGGGGGSGGYNTIGTDETLSPLSADGPSWEVPAPRRPAPPSNARVSPANAQGSAQASLGHGGPYHSHAQAQGSSAYGGMVDDFHEPWGCAVCGDDGARAGGGAPARPGGA